MFKTSKKTFVAAAAATALVASPAAAQIKIGWTAWSDAEFVTKMAKKILEDRLDEDVELVQTGIAPQYQGVASGDIDVMLMSWQPSTHSDYLENVGNKTVDLGMLYGHARLGWVVPDYVPKDQLNSLADLQSEEMADKLNGTITGIDPGAGLTRLSKQAIKDYNLGEVGFNLQTSSGAGMTAAFERATSNEEWIVATSWTPHWMFGRWDARFLKDPKGSLGSFERIHAIAREGFYQENIDAAMTLSRMQLPLEQLQAAMFDAQETSYSKAVDKYIEENSERVDYWVTGEMGG